MITTCYLFIYLLRIPQIILRVWVWTRTGKHCVRMEEEVLSVGEGEGEGVRVRYSL